MHKIIDECIACGTCAEVCSSDSIKSGETKYIILDTCTDCGTCVESCPVEAIKPPEA
ncbi:MAG: ferredoxin [Candidatus Schekmanbacteria bacterium RBG_16_38_11]|uniref:Ferredoxin n=2 Tax=Candidatus Schekmaniibacteriota TaxID=1817811 RepID=A0A1F7RLG3_9BACT|nr:MAG: ferredoxin [Candidatus Schekmanbacteria bacterium GWA2_38_11]OGL44451.1 MAG: ferredoxin [Candidatus Schekmanbacteria bacterium RBG_16_38_11]